MTDFKGDAPEAAVRNLRPAAGGHGGRRAVRWIAAGSAIAIAVIIVALGLRLQRDAAPPPGEAVTGAPAPQPTEPLPGNDTVAQLEAAPGDPAGPDQADEAADAATAQPVELHPVDDTVGQAGAPPVKRTRRRSQQVTQEFAPFEGTPMFISSAGTRQLQRALNERGYEAGNLTGAWNPKTAAAVANAQRTLGVEPTGTLTVDVILALGLIDVLTPASTPRDPDQTIILERVEHSGTPLNLSTAGVRVIQQALNEQGYIAGTVNGEWTDQARQAAISFKEAVDLEPTGVIDLALIAALGVGADVFAIPDVNESAERTLRFTQEEATGEGEPIFLGPAGVRLITVALNKEGYDAGPVDGDWDEQMSRAVVNYQQAHHLEPTGTLTTSFMSQIGLGNWLEQTIQAERVVPTDQQITNEQAG